jgi:hypothetical protein
MRRKLSEDTQGVKKTAEPRALLSAPPVNARTRGPGYEDRRAMYAFTSRSRMSSGMAP